MKRNFYLTMAAVLTLSAASPVHARDDKHLFPIAAAMATKEAKEKLDGSIKYFFGDQETPKILAKLGTDVTNQKTNGLGKPVERACNWVFLSAMTQLDKRAKQLGANAVINIVSYYQRNAMSSPTEFECYKGAVMAAVSFRGEFVKIAE
jgi:uncharacterized protein YbjQ (UPF0145 family)